MKSLEGGRDELARENTAPREVVRRIVFLHTFKLLINHYLCLQHGVLSVHIRSIKLVSSENFECKYFIVFPLKVSYVC